jgi:hypothetical protein
MTNPMASLLQQSTPVLDTRSIVPYQLLNINSIRWWCWNIATDESGVDCCKSDAIGFVIVFCFYRHSSYELYSHRIYRIWSLVHYVTYNMLLLLYTCPYNDRPTQLKWYIWVIVTIFMILEFWDEHIYKIYIQKGRCGRGRLVVGFTTTYAISTYHN